jgi:hypothetical protein
LVQIELELIDHGGMNIFKFDVCHPYNPINILGGDPLGGYRIGDLLPSDPPLGELSGSFPFSCGYELALLGC